MSMFPTGAEVVSATEAARAAAETADAPPVYIETDVTAENAVNEAVRVAVRTDAAEAVREEAVRHVHVKKVRTGGNGVAME